MVPEERQALELLTSLPAYVWDGKTLPLPVEEIAESIFSLRIRDVSPGELAAATGAPDLDGGDTLSGLLLVDAQEIWVNADEAARWPGRRRFTVGHELGHWCLHREEGVQQRVFCRKHAVSLDAIEPGAPNIEEEASLFAGGLLFPDALVRLEWERLGGDIAELGARFGGSRVATERAVFRAVREPLVRACCDGEVLGFYWNDPPYEAWLAANQVRGHVVSDSFSEPGRLHRAACSYLAAPAVAGRPRTRAPKWCSTDVGALRRAVPDATPCRRCS